MQHRPLLSVLAAAGCLVSVAAGSGLTWFETPRDRDGPVLAAIRGAERRIEVEIYELTDPDVEAALVAAHGEGRAVRVILNGRFPDRINTNQSAFVHLKSVGIAVR